MKNKIYLLTLLLVFLCDCASAPRYTTGPTLLSTKSKASKTSQNKSSKSNNVKHRKVMNGVSSFYAEDFHGKLTANGEVYDMYGLTAVSYTHLTLPTILLV